MAKKKEAVAPVVKTTEGRGLYQKYTVKRVDGRDGTGGDRVEARYFVLDYIHDADARQLLSEYADRVEKRKPKLAADIRKELAQTKDMPGRLIPVAEDVKNEGPATLAEGAAPAQEVATWEGEGGAGTPEKEDSNASTGGGEGS